MRFCGNCGARLGQAAASNPGPGAALQPDLTAVPEQLGVLMGADLADRLQRAGIEAAGQRRNVTILFTDLSGYTSLSQRMDSEDVYELVQRYIQVLLNDVYKYEGIVDKLTGDGLMALFGAPIAHENNAERAVRAALDMQEDVKDLAQELLDSLGIQISMRIGLHAGTVVVGGVGSNLMMDYTAIGDTVNLAHRIEEAAPPGSILVSESVRRQTRALFDFQQVSVLHPKGIDHPVAAFSVVGAKSQPGSVRGIEGLRAPMIGRESELNCLVEAIADLTNRNRGQVIFITGEAGLGKSRLTAEFRAALDHYPVRVLEGQSLAYRRSISYWIFQDLLYSFLGLPRNTPQARVSECLKEWVQDALGRQAKETLAYIEHLLSLPYSDPATAERLRYLNAEQLRQQIFLAVRDLFLAEAQKKPLLVILEDLHWADEASLDLTHFLLELLRKAPIFILAISRQILPGAMTKMVDWAQANLGERFQHIQLKHLSLDQSERLLFQLITTPALPEKLRNQILMRSAGIPFYLEEILRMLIDQGAIRFESNGWQIVPEVDGTDLGVPETLQGLNLARFDRLDNHQRRVLQAASVIGKNFSLPVLTGVLKTTNFEKLQQSFDYLVARDFILHNPEDPKAEYTFRHILMSDAIYSTILRRERSKMHGDVGRVIETLYADRLDTQVELLANHYLWSPDKDRALHYSILAGQKAAASYANVQSQQHYEQALELLSKVAHTTMQAIQVHMGLGDVLVLVGDYAQARSHFEEALKSIAGEIHGSFIQENSILERKIGTTYERQGEYEMALAHLSEAQSSLEGRSEPLPVEKALIKNDIGWIQFGLGNLNAAQEHLSQALSLLENTDHYDVIASIYNRLGGVFYQSEQLDQASYYVRKSLVLREEIGDTVAVARSYNNLGLLGWKKGDWDNALENFKHSVKLHANLGDIEGTIQLRSNIGLLLTDKGELEEARQQIEDSLQGALQIGHGFMEGLAYHHLTRYWLAAKDWQKALEFGQRALKEFEEIHAQENLVDVYASIGEAWIGLGYPKEARQAGETGLNLLQDTHESNAQAMPEWGRIRRLLGNVARIQGDFENANQMLKESVATFTRLSNQLELGRTLVALALLAQSRQDRTGFRLYLNEARLIFQQLGARLDLQTVSQIEQ